MKKLFDRWMGAGSPHGAAAPDPGDDAGYFATTFMERDDAPSLIAASTARSRLVSSEPCSRARGVELLRRAWGEDHFMAQLSAIEVEQLADYLEFVSIPAGREVIAQDEPGDFALIVLEGLLSVDRIQPWGGRARLAEAREGDVLGELSLLDAGSRFCSCTTRSACVMAVINAAQLDAMMKHAPRAGMALMACMSRRLSLRMRQVSARLSALLSAT